MNAVTIDACVDADVVVVGCVIVDVVVLDAAYCVQMFRCLYHCYQRHSRHLCHVSYLTVVMVDLVPS